MATNTVEFDGHPYEIDTSDVKQVAFANMAAKYEQAVAGFVDTIRKIKNAAETWLEPRNDAEAVTALLDLSVAVKTWEHAQREVVRLNQDAQAAAWAAGIDLKA